MPKVPAPIPGSTPPAAVLPTPTMEHRLAKARLHQVMEEQSAIYSWESLTLELITRFCGTPKVERWLKELPWFPGWLLDSEEFSAKSIAYSEIAIEKLYEILVTQLDPSDKSLTAKDQLNAAKLLLELGSRFPNKRKELVYLDKDLNAMPEHEVDEELQRTKQRLGLT